MRRKKPGLLLSLPLATLIVTLALMGAARSQARVAVAYVAPSGVDQDNDCTAADAPCATIQHAVNQAHDGDEIRIATFDIRAGGGGLPALVTATARYTGTGADVVHLTKSLTLRGGYAYLHVPNLPATWVTGPVPATVDGEGSRRALYVGGEITPTLRNLAFVNGRAERGGNVYVESARPIFVATSVLSGDATYGGGLYLRGGAPTLAALTVYSNVATADGGGLYLEGGQPLIAGAMVRENRAGGRGGGLFLEKSAARVAGTTVYSNVAASGGGFYLDGPLAFSETTLPIIANNYVRYNRAAGQGGGGLYLRQAIAGLVNNVVAENGAEDGAALYLWASSPQLFHNTVARNRGRTGIHLTHRVGALWPPSPPIPSLPAFTNTIVASHSLGIHVETTGLFYPLENRATLAGTLWWGNGEDTAGPGQVVDGNAVSGDPRFVCTGDWPDCPYPYHIRADSAALDAGVNVALTLPGSDLFVDIDGQLRPSGGGYDVGADEVQRDTYSLFILPPLSTRSARPGQTVTHTHRLLNTGLGTDTYDLALSSERGWSALADDAPLTLRPQTSATVQVRVTVPDTASNGMRETARLTATSRAAEGREAYALDVTAVVSREGTSLIDPLDLAVDKVADRETVDPGGTVRYTLTLTQTGRLTGTLPVTLTDLVAPPRALEEWHLPAGCTGNLAAGLITCTVDLAPGSLRLTRTPRVESQGKAWMMVITTTDTYSGLLVNTVTVKAAAPDARPSNNVAQVVVGVIPRWQIYLSLMLRGHTP